ncbi:MAG: sensor histidine kinase [Bacteroidota bacterium]
MLDSAEIAIKQGFALVDTVSERAFLVFGQLNYSAANLELDRENYSKASEFAQNTIRVYSQYGRPQDVFETRALLGQILVKMNDPKALSELKAAYGYFADSKHYNYLMPVARLVATEYTQYGPSDSAMKYWQVFAAVRDTFYSRDRANALELAQTRFQTREKTQALASTRTLLEKEQEVTRLQSRNIWLIGIGLALTVILGGLAGLGFLQKRRANARLEIQKAEISRQNEEKADLLREIHHRVKNNLQIVSSLLELQSRSVSDAKMQAITREGQGRVRSMALIHQNLYQNEAFEISIDDYVGKLVAEIQRLYGQERQVKSELETSDLNFDIDTAVPLGLIINELVTNAFKYGFSETDEKKLRITLKKHDEEFYKLSIQDNGNGLPADLDWKKTRSMGLRLVRRLAMQLHGRLEYENLDGAAYTIWFKDTLTRKLAD